MKVSPSKESDVLDNREAETWARSEKAGFRLVSICTGSRAMVRRELVWTFLYGCPEFVRSTFKKGPCRQNI